MADQAQLDEPKPRGGNEIGLTAIREYIWARYVDNEWDRGVEHDEEQILQQLARHYETHSLETDPEGYELWETPYGRFWMPDGDEKAVAILIAQQEVDQYGAIHGGIGDGDVVLDAGAHVGLYARKAVEKGAKTVVAIEPAPANLECLRRNLAAEIAARRNLRRTYDAALAGIPHLRLHGTRTGASESLVYYAVRLDPALRERLYPALASGGILARNHFPLLCGAGTHWAGTEIVVADGGPALAPELGRDTSPTRY